MPGLRRRWTVLFAAELLLVLAAFALRVYHLENPGFEVDEAHSMRFVAYGYWGIVTTAMTVEPHPPLFYLLLRSWYLLVGANEAALRFPALVMNVLAVPTIVRLCRRLGWDPAGMVAATLFAFNPYQLYYAQNARMYGMLVLFAVLSTYLGVRYLESRSLRDALTATGCTLVVVFTHYYGIFHAAFVGGFVLLVLLARHAPWADVRRWLGAMSLAAVLLLAWLAASYRVSLYFERADQSTATVDSLLSAMGDALPKHSLGVAIPDAARAYVPFAFLAIALVGLACAWRRGAVFAGWERALLVGGYLATPLVIGFLVSLVRVMYEPRYFMASAPAFFIALGLGVVGLYRLLPPIGVAALLVLLGGQAAGVRTYLDENQYVRSEFTVGYAYVHEHLQPGDGIVLDCADQITQFDYYHKLKYADPTPYYVLPDGAPTPAALDARVDEIMAKHGSVWLLDYGAGACDIDHRVERTLATRDYRALYQPLIRNRVTYYVSDHAAEHRVVRPNVDCNGDLTVTGAAVAEQPLKAGVVLPVSLDLVPARPTQRDYVVSWRLIDAAGRVALQRDSAPNAGFVPSRTWQPDRVVSDHLGFLLPTSLLPGKYTLGVGMYDRVSGQRCVWRASGKELPGELLTLGDVSVRSGAPDRSLAEPTVGHAVGAGAADLKLSGYDVDAGPFLPGGVVPLRLLWRAVGQPAADYQVVAERRDPRARPRAATTRPIGDDYPTSRWTADRPALTPLDVPVPARASNGPQTIALALALPGGGTVPLASVPVQVAGRERSFTPPAGAEQPIARFGPAVELLRVVPKAADVRLDLGLTWRAAGELTTAYKVFTHLVGPDGKMYGQDDAVPLRGAAPTTGWASGEVLADDYHLTLAAGAPDGEYQVIVGLYDPAGGGRLPVDRGGDGFVAARPRLVGGKLLLP